MDHTPCDPLYLASLTWHNIFTVHLYVVPCIRISSFLWLGTIPLYGYTTYCLSIHLGHLDDFHLLAHANNAIMNIHVQDLFGHVFSILLGILPGIELQR